MSVCSRNSLRFSLGCLVNDEILCLVESKFLCCPPRETLRAKIILLSVTESVPFYPDLRYFFPIIQKISSHSSRILPMTSLRILLFLHFLPLWFLLFSSKLFFSFPRLVMALPHDFDNLRSRKERWDDEQLALSSFLFPGLFSSFELNLFLLILTLAHFDFPAVATPRLLPFERKSKSPAGIEL